MIGRSIAHYHVTDLLGEGGMGQVYRATDTKLHRDVALKVLPDAFTSDPQRMARFEREARVLASLNHPNIGTIYGLEEQDGAQFLVLELIEGETLEDRLRRGAIPVLEAQSIALKIVEALEAAHEKGVIHRDLKPANIKITPEGTVKVLDFGLAKAADEDAGQTDISHSPTLTMQATQAGIILGTAAYMSPEQAQGLPVDRRADIWSFGVVLYEMLTGKRLFQADGVGGTLAAVLRDPIDLKELPGESSSAIRRLLRRCLERSPTKRLRDIGDARLELLEAGEGSAEASPLASPARQGSHTGWYAAAALAMLSAMLVVWMVLSRPTQTTIRSSEFSINLPEVPTLGGQERVLAISPNGDRMVFVAGQSAQLYVRDIGDADARVLPETEGAESPFFSPDGEWIGFFSNRQLKKVAVAGGSPVPLAESQSNRGGTWTEDNRIIFSASVAAPLSEVSALGGEVRSLTTRESGERTHRWPIALPAMKGVLFLVGFTEAVSDFEQARIEHYSFETGQRTILVNGGYSPLYSAATGDLLFVRSGILQAAPLNPASPSEIQSSQPVFRGFDAVPESGTANLALSEDGSLLFIPASADLGTERVLNRVSLDGQRESLPFPEGDYSWIAAAPHANQVALVVGRGGKSDIWIFDLDSGDQRQLTFSGQAFSPVWSGDGESLSYTDLKAIYLRPAVGSGDPELVLEAAALEGGSGLNIWPAAWSSDGDLLIFTRGTVADLYAEGPGEVGLFSRKTGEITWLLRGGDNGNQTRYRSFSISPDQQWALFSRRGDGENLITVASFPDFQGQQDILPYALFPTWSPDGNQIYYSDAGYSLWRVSFSATGSSFSTGTPERLFGADLTLIGPAVPLYDVLADGHHVVEIGRRATPQGSSTLPLLRPSWARQVLQQRR